MTEDVLNNKTPINDLTIGGNIYTAGNAKEFNSNVSMLELRPKTKKTPRRNIGSKVLT